MTTASEHSLILPATADLVWGTVSFVIVALAIFKFAWPTFMRLLDERTQKIDEGLNQAERAREEAARERAALADEVDEARRVIKGAGLEPAVIHDVVTPGGESTRVVEIRRRRG